MPNVCVIIPMYNFNDMTHDCVRLIKENWFPGLDIVIVDDCSQYPYEKQNGEHLIRLDKNLGFTAAVNEGIKYASNKYDYIMILNNDTEPCPDFIQALVDVMEADKTIAIAGSVRKVPMNGEGSYELGGMDWIRGHSKLAWQKETQVMDFEWVPFCSVLIRYSVIQEIGLLDKQMKNYCSDCDYCIRVRNAGYRVVIVPQSEVLHYRGVTIIENKDTLDLGKDQKIFLEKLSGFKLQERLGKLPLDVERKIWGKISFYTEEN